MHRAAALLLTLTCLVLVAGCGSSDDEAASASPLATPTGSGPTPSSLRPVAGIGQVQDLLAGDTDLDIVIFSDSTADELTEWPALWAEEMSDDHAVTLHRWLNGPARYQPLELSSDGPARTVWSCSVSGWRAAHFFDLVDECMPEPAELTIISLGHNNNSEPDQAVPQISELISLVQARAQDPSAVVITVQNPVTAPERLPAADWVSDDVRAWAREQGVPAIDVYSAFHDADEDVSALLKDGLHPNDDGSRVWAETVVSTLTPDTSAAATPAEQ